MSGDAFTNAPPAIQRLALTAIGSFDVDMSGLNLVRHHLQQAQAQARYLVGGDQRSELLDDALDLTAEDAAAGVRVDLAAAIAALDAYEGVHTDEAEEAPWTPQLAGEPLEGPAP